MGSICGKAKGEVCSEFLTCEDNVEDLKHVVCSKWWLVNSFLGQKNWWRTAFCRHHLGTDKGDEKAGCQCFQKMSFLVNISSYIQRRDMALRLKMISHSLILLAKQGPCWQAFHSIVLTFLY